MRAADQTAGRRAVGADTSSALILTARISLLVAAAAAVTVGAFEMTSSPSRSRADYRFSCPMHREVGAATASDCPICGMRLERVRERQTASLALAGVTTRIVADEIRAPAWCADDGSVVAMLSKEDLVGLPAGAQGRFFPARGPTEGSKVSLISAPTPSPEPTTMLRFRREARASKANRGDVGWLVLPARARALLVVPPSAVVKLADGPHLFVATEDGSTLVRRAVELGRVRHGEQVVLSGVTEHERVAAGGAFFLEAEGRLAGSAGQELR